MHSRAAPLTASVPQSFEKCAPSRAFGPQEWYVDTVQPGDAVFFRSRFFLALYLLFLSRSHSLTNSPSFLSR